MSLRVVQFLAIMMAALGLSPGMAHVLELAPKMSYDPDRYLAVTSTLYRMFGFFGAIIQVGSIVIVAALTWLSRRRRSFRLALCALIGLVLSLTLWATIVQPVNVQWAGALQADHSTALAAYMRLRPRWEYGHVAAFSAWLIGFSCLVLSVLRDAQELDFREVE